MGVRQHAHFFCSVLLVTTFLLTRPAEEWAHLAHSASAFFVRSTTLNTLPYAAQTETFPVSARPLALEEEGSGGGEGRGSKRASERSDPRASSPERRQRRREGERASDRTGPVVRLFALFGVGVWVGKASERGDGRDLDVVCCSLVGFEVVLLLPLLQVDESMNGP